MHWPNFFSLRSQHKMSPLVLSLAYPHWPEPEEYLDGPGHQQNNEDM